MDEDGLARNPWHAHADAFAAWTSQRYGAAPEETSPIVAALLDALGDVAEREVLDAACGEGLLARVLARRGARVTGVDVSPRLVELARQRDPAGAIAYRVADLTRPVPELVGRFDLIGSHLALNDVADHRGFAVTLAALLRPGGRLALAFNNPYSSVVRGHVAGYFDAGALGIYGGMSERLGGTVRYYHRTLEQYLGAFLETGLRLARLVDVREDRPFPFFMVLAFEKPSAPE
jgi:2-polyprenyl-3-methyl-5-hydroxy-6-metoxy-1,4-benzoquinol methylase